ncbi:MAG TPA: hypothetical protein VN924_00985 [Bryobacteraceae bacterium]|jgi:hypothetical protein|nr:hypothetical protein [Bryobacteraceae bacterium]
MSVDGVANVASIVGAALAVPSLVQIFRTKRVADEVKDRVSSVEAKLAKLGAVDARTAIVAELDEIKHLHRLGVWTILPARYSAIRRRLISLKIENASLSQQESTLQSMIQQFSDMEHKIEVAIAADRPPKDVPSLTRVLAQQADRLNEMHSFIRKAMEEEQ